MKKLILLLLLTWIYPMASFSAIDECKTDIYFANGILTKEGAAQDNAEEVLKPAILEKIYGGNIEEFNKHIGIVSYAYNTTYGMAPDLFESFLQKVDESHVIATLWNGFKVWIGQRLRGVDDIIGLFEAGTHAAENADLSLQIEKYTQSIESGHGVVVVAHSQGNLFTNKAFQKLKPWQQDYFHMIGVASLANYVNASQVNQIFDELPFYLS